MSTPGIRAVIVLVATLFVSSCSSNGATGPHGNPDPGGKRMAALVSVARQVIPDDATSTQLALTKSAWGQGGCDGGAPGWTIMKAVETFHASGHVVAEIDATMRRLHWVDATQIDPSLSTQEPPPAEPGPDLPYVRQYQQSSDASSPVALLFTPRQAGGSSWELDLEAGPAEVPDHSC